MIFSDGTEVLLSEDRQVITFVGEGGRREVQPRRNMEHRYVRLEEARGVGGWVEETAAVYYYRGLGGVGGDGGQGSESSIARQLKSPAHYRGHYILLLTLVAAPRTTTPPFCGRLSRAPLFEKIRVLLALGNKNDGFVLCCA